MREEDSCISMIDQWSDQMDDMWAKVLNEVSDDDDDESIILRSKPEKSPSGLDSTLDNALKLVDEDKVEGLGCFLDSMLLCWTPEEEKAYAKTRARLNKEKDLGLPPRPGSKRRIRTKPREEKRQEDTKEDGGFLSYMFGSVMENEEREQSQPQTTDADMNDVVDTESIALARKISFKRVGSSFRRAVPEAASEPTHEPTPEDDFFGVKGAARENRKDEPEDHGVLGFMFGEEDEQQIETREDFKSQLKTKLKTKFKAAKKKKKVDDEENDKGYLSFMFDNKPDDHLETATTCSHKSTSSIWSRPSVAKKFARNGGERSRSGDESVSSANSAQVRLARRTNSRNVHEGRSDSLRRLHSEGF